MNIIAISKVHQSRIFIPKDIREYMKLEDGNKIVWKIDYLNNLIIIEKQKIKTRFQNIKKEE